ncbi:histone deacetylase complex subunit SAP25 isoform X2 [Sorex araneus]|uniref:histone deacetylase complex subunit SAP25 isoform X2 n=1 Tax=Sorex araneus TaxID=42254 RepID=UPI002433B56D|nr:histone deacetylase complex subunit SAP25 isoform X2 [Sorex araneus]
MQPWPPRSRSPRDLPAQEETAPLAGASVHEAWSAGEAAGEEPTGAPRASPQTRARTPCWTPRALRPPDLAAELTWGTPGTPAPVAPQRAWEVRPARVTLLEPWDPNYQVTWGPGCSSGASFSSRTLYHPSFWPLYQAAAGPAQQSEVGAPEGVPVLCCEDIFLLDPLLPRGQRVPLYLSEPPGQVKGSGKLLLPPPIMAPWVLPSRPRGCPGAWLSGAELIALTGLLQMSQGPPRPAPDPSEDTPSPSGGQSCARGAAPSLPPAP